ncbi:AAA family ATPase [Nanohaloarchaea archaeon H01]|nr:AAA family ATPase [Nanohaloarchaea archaeon H01]
MDSHIEQFQEDREKESEIVVTVDGPSGSGKGTLGKYIAEKLGIKHFSAGDFFRSIAEDRGITHTELAEIADKETDIEVDRRTLEKGLEESCVIDGRLPSWVLGDYSDLKVYLTADLEERARRIAEREDKDIEKVEEETRKRDEENRRRYSEYYGIDTENLDIYDLVIDNTEISIEEQEQMINKVLKQKFPEYYRR